jgi:hypothetical protein
MSENRPHNIFISYAHTDAIHFAELVKHLTPLRIRKLISPWTDQEILPGMDWQKEINQAIEAADIFILLVSIDFINSDYCMGVEMKRALERRAAGQLQMVPIILSSCNWENLDFAKLNAEPSPPPIVPILEQQYPAKAWTRVVKRLGELIKSSPPPDPSPVPLIEVIPSGQSLDQASQLAQFEKERFRKEVELLQGVNLYLLGEEFVGRERELNDLDLWLLEGPEKIFCLSNLGGTGKSALVWHWFNHARTTDYLVDQGYRRFWATFYARNFDAEKYLEALAIELGGVPIHETSASRDSMSRLADWIIKRLKQEKWVLVLDGLEREMGAFTNPENYQVDSEEQDRRNENREVLSEEEWIRGDVFPTFLRNLAHTQAKTIITTRIFPQNLKNDPSVKDYQFGPLAWGDGEKLWSGFCQTVSEADKNLLRKFFDQIGLHPQVILAVAAAVDESGQSFRKWFDNFAEADRAACLDEKSLKTTLRHRWLDLATRDLIERRPRDQWLTLCYIVRNSEASQLEKLESALVEKETSPELKPGHFATFDKLKVVLDYLAKRRLIGVDYNLNLVDVHPVIRGQVMSYILRQFRGEANVDSELMDHLKSGDTTDLIQRILGQPDFDTEHLDRLMGEIGDIPNAGSTALRLLHSLYPESKTRGNSPWLESLPISRLRREQAMVLEKTASELMRRSLPTDWEQSEVLYRRAITAYRLCGDKEAIERIYQFRSWQELYAGDLFTTEQRILDELEQPERARPNAVYWLALVLSIHSNEPMVADLLQRLEPQSDDRWKLQTVAEAWLYLDRYDKARELAARALDRREKEKWNVGQLLWERVTLGLALLRQGRTAEAHDHLSFALDRGTGWAYNIIPMFALAGLIEKKRLESTLARNPINIAEIELINKRYAGVDPQGKFQIPAAEVALSMAHGYVECGDFQQAREWGERVRSIASGSRPGFGYRSVLKRLKRLEGLGISVKQSDSDFEVISHQRRLDEWWKRWKEKDEQQKMDK